MSGVVTNWTWPRRTRANSERLNVQVSQQEKQEMAENYDFLC
jgi:hypothetical protein